MQLRRKLGWSFLIYLILLLNLGPGLHRAGIFGLHSHQTSESFDFGDGFELSETCGCCNHSLPLKSDDSPSGSISKLPDECSFCQFFSKYQVTFTVSDLVLSESESVLDSSEQLPFAPEVQIIAQARGPPTV